MVVARAVAEMRVLAELCLPFVRPGGAWVALKGPDPEASQVPLWSLLVPTLLLMQRVCDRR